MIRPGGPRFTRSEIRARLQAKVDAGQPLLLGGAGVGLVAKVLDRAGIDVLMAYNTGPFRMDGHGSLAGYLAYGDANAITLELARHVLPVVRTTPVVAGVGAADPYRDVEELVGELIRLGCSGITNVPTAGIYDGTFRRHIDATDLGYPREIELIRLCASMDVFTVAYAFDPQEAAAMAEAGADLIGAHVGLTEGGLIGAHEVPELDVACARMEAIAGAARAVRPDVLVVAHGGPTPDPASVQAVYDRVDVDGFLGASSIERLPLEEALTRTVAAYQALTLRRSR